MRTRFQQFLIRCKPLTEKLSRHTQVYFQKAKAYWQPWQNKLMMRWQSFETREKNIIRGGGAVVGLLLFYALIWSPFNDHLDHLRQLIQSEKKTAIWMEAADKQIKSLESRQEKPSSRSISRRLNAVQEALSQAPLHSKMSQLAQSSPEEIRCVFDQVDFDTLIAWLIRFSQDQDLIIKQASIQKLNNVGLVKAELVFRVS